MPPKRPNDGSQNGHGYPDEGGAKRVRANNAADATQSTLIGGERNDRAGGSGGANKAGIMGNSIQAQIEAAKARAAALMARTGVNRQSGNVSAPAAAAATSSVAPTSAVPSLPNANTNAPAFDPQSIQAKIAEAKRRADEMARGRFGAKPSTISSTAQQVQPSSSSDRSQSSAGIHPLLMNNGGAAPPSAGSQRGPNSRHMAPKHSVLSSGASTSYAKPASQIIHNPYLTTAEDEEIAQAARGRARKRNMTFNAPGRHIRAAEEARREAQMEALKRRIEEQARKAGLQELTAEERALRRPQPPDVEWWDQPFLPDQTSYEVVFEQNYNNDERMLITGKGSPIDFYVQHPIPIPAPSDRVRVESKGVMLTKKEQKKMRRMRRRAEQEDKQDKIKMGLLPPDPPKVKLSNLMRVLTSEAVADPTKVEARVRRQVAARQDKHEQDNVERMLTPEQRRAKLEEEKQRDLAKGVYTLVFKIRHLVSPSHKFKVRKNALQNGLTGIALFGKDFALVLVEGGQKGIKAYRHLMINRIKWHDPGQPKAEADDTFLADLEGGRGGEQHRNLSDEQDALAGIDWGENYCKILFEGPMRDRQFPFGFKARTCEADIDAKEALGPKMSSYWDLARRQDRASEDV